MASDNGRRCIAFKKVNTEFGPARRCKRFAEVDEVKETEKSARKHGLHYRGFSSASAALNSSYKGMDLAIGAAAGLVGTVGVKYLANKFLAGKLPAAVISYFPLFGAAATGAALYFGEKKSSRGMAHAAGAVLAGGAVAAWSVLETQFSSILGMSDVVAFKYDGYGRPYGILQNDYAPMSRMANYGGLLVDDSGNKGLSSLGAMSMGDDDDGANALLGL